MLHKADACITRVPKLNPPSIIRKTNQINDIHVDKPTNPLREWNIQPTADHFKQRNSTPKTSPVVSDTMGILNHNAIDNGNVKVHPYDFGLNNRGLIELLIHNDGRLENCLFRGPLLIKKNSSIE